MQKDRSPKSCRFCSKSRERAPRKELYGIGDTSTFQIREYANRAVGGPGGLGTSNVALSSHVSSYGSALTTAPPHQVGMAHQRPFEERHSVDVHVRVRNKDHCRSCFAGLKRPRGPVGYRRWLWEHARNSGQPTPLWSEQGDGRDHNPWGYNNLESRAGRHQARHLRRGTRQIGLRAVSGAVGRD